MPMIPEQDKELLCRKFGEEMQVPVTILLYTQREGGQPSEFESETLQLIDELAGLSGKLTVEVREYVPESDELAIGKLPALLLGFPSGAVRYYGIPGGFLFSSLVETLVDLSRGETDLSDAVKDKVRALNQRMHIEVFATPTCPYCPAAIRIAHEMAIENPDYIRVDAVEATEFPDLVSKYELAAVPTIVVNGKVAFEGALPDDEFLERILATLDTQSK